MNSAIEAYRAAGEETRLRILRLLRQAPGELCVCEVVYVLEKPQYAVSKSLTVLRKAGLVEERRDGKFMKYKLRSSPFNDKVFESLDAIPATAVNYKGDSRRLAKRLALRETLGCADFCK